MDIVIRSPHIFISSYLYLVYIAIGKSIFIFYVSEYLWIGTVYEDVTTEVLGEIGTWQWLVTSVAAALMTPSIFNQYDDMFLLNSTEVICVTPNHYQTPNSSYCFKTIISNGTQKFKCDKWHIKLLWMIWIKKTWLIFCDEKLQALSVAIISRFGSIFGYVIFGLIADSFGRRKSMLFSVFADVGLGLTITFCDSEAWFRLLVFLKALFGSSNSFMGLILICEIASNRWRSWLSVIVATPRLLSSVFVVPLVNTTPNSETYSFIAFVCGVCLIFVIISWTPESPQWLLYNRQINQAEKLLFEAAKKNGVKLSKEFKIRPVNRSAYNCLDESRIFLKILTKYNIKMLIFCSFMVWCLYFFIWNSLYVSVYSEKPVNHVLMVKVVSFTAVFVFLAVTFSMKLKLKHLLVAYILVTGVFTVSGMVFKQINETIDNILTSTALGSGLVGHALILILTPRFFAIHLRATLVGCCLAAGQLGSMISYSLILSGAINKILTAFLVTVSLIILILLCYIFPDVDGRELPDTLEDMDYFSELTKSHRWATQKTDSPSSEEVEIRIYSFGSNAAGLSSYTRSESGDRTPAKRIGFMRLWNRFAYQFQQLWCSHITRK